MAIVRIPGPKRQFRDTKTGEILGRREADRRLGRVIKSNEAKAKENKKANLIESLSRPARGRKKINPVQDFEEVQSRVFNERLKRVHIKKINRALLKTGHRAERVNFFTYDQYVSYMESMKGQKAPNGMPLITSVGIGVNGHNIQSTDFGKVLAATIVPQQSISMILSQSEFEEKVHDWLEGHAYFEIEFFWLHLHFNREYAESRVTKAQNRKLKKMGLR